MGRITRKPKGRHIQPNLFVFCEGESEMEYIGLLRRTFRCAIKTFKAKSNLSKRDIDSQLKEFHTADSDKVFAMFDLDVDGIYERLRKIDNLILLVSNPCFEFWLLLHFKDCRSRISTQECFRQLGQFLPGYKKGTLTLGHEQLLIANLEQAIDRANALSAPENPSTTVGDLLAYLKKV